MRTFIALVLTSALAACGLAGPASVARHHLEAIEQGDFATAEGMYTSAWAASKDSPKREQMAELAASMRASRARNEGKLTFSIEDEKVEGETVRAHLIIKGQEGKDHLGLFFRMQKEAGAWRIAGFD